MSTLWRPPDFISNHLRLPTNQELNSKAFGSCWTFGISLNVYGGMMKLSIFNVPKPYCFSPEITSLCSELLRKVFALTSFSKLKTPLALKDASADSYYVVIHL